MNFVNGCQTGCQTDQASCYLCCHLWNQGVQSIKFEYSVILGYNLLALLYVCSWGCGGGLYWLCYSGPWDSVLVSALVARSELQTVASLPKVMLRAGSRSVDIGYSK